MRKTPQPEVPGRDPPSCPRLPHLHAQSGRNDTAAHPSQFRHGPACMRGAPEISASNLTIKQEPALHPQAPRALKLLDCVWVSCAGLPRAGQGSWLHIPAQLPGSSASTRNNPSLVANEVCEGIGLKHPTELTAHPACQARASAEEGGAKAHHQARLRL